MRHRSYHERERARAENQRHHNQTTREMRAVYANQIMRDYEEAYRAVHGVDAAVLKLEYKDGYVRGKGILVRLSELEKMTRVLWARTHEQEIEQ